MPDEAQHHQHSATIEGRLVRLETLLEIHERDLVLLRPVPAALTTLQTEVTAIRSILDRQDSTARAEFDSLRSKLDTANGVVIQLNEEARVRHEAEVHARHVRDVRTGRFFQYLGGLLASLLVLVGGSLYNRSASLLEGGVLWVAVGLFAVCMIGLLVVSVKSPVMPQSDAHP